MRRRWAIWGSTLLFALVMLFHSAKAVAAGPHDDANLPSVRGTLSADQVVDNLIKKNLERAHALAQSQATRIYHLAYRGFPSDRDAEMTVEATFRSPSTKEFKVVSQSGSKIILDRVFKKLLESEKEAADPSISSGTQLNRDNYEFQADGFEPSPTGGQYRLKVTPRQKSKFVYHGTIWVDATDFAVTKIEAEPAQNPSFWTKKSEIHHEYKKFDGFWLPVRNESISYIRLGGRATLTIEYRDYHVTGLHPIEAITASVRN